jgi:hypothetical protein
MFRAQRCISWRWASVVASIGILALWVTLAATLNWSRSSQLDQPSANVPSVLRCDFTELGTSHGIMPFVILTNISDENIDIDYTSDPFDDLDIIYLDELGYEVYRFDSYGHRLLNPGRKRSIKLKPGESYRSSIGLDNRELLSFPGKLNIVYAYVEFRYRGSILRSQRVVVLPYSDR